MIHRRLIRGCDGELLPITLAQVSAMYHLIQTKSMCPLETLCLTPLQAAFHTDAAPIGGQTRQRQHMRNARGYRARIIRQARVVSCMPLIEYVDHNATSIAFFR